MKKGDEIYVIGLNGSSIEKGVFTGNVVKFLSMIKLEIKTDKARMVAVEQCVPVTDETRRLVNNRQAFEQEARQAAQKAQTALEKLWFLRVNAEEAKSLV